MIPKEGQRDFLAVAYPMCIDIYKTFSPMKQSTFSMVIAIVELTALMTDKYVKEVIHKEEVLFHWLQGLQQMMEAWEERKVINLAKTIKGRFELWILNCVT